MMTANTLKQLYEIDEDQWLVITIDLLKQKQFNKLDLENLIEELESLGRSKKNAVESFLEQIIRYLLLLQYWTQEYGRNSGHWEAEIFSFRKQLSRRLTTSLRNYLSNQIDLIYQDALEYVQKKTKYQIDFPQECPYTLEQLLNISDSNTQ